VELPDKTYSRYCYKIDNIVKTLVELKGDFAMYQGHNNFKEIISGNARHIGGGEKEMRKYIYLFKWVKKDAEKYLREHPDLEVLNIVQGDDYYINYINQDNIDTAINRNIIAEIGAVDIKQAYWGTAFQIGIISKKTFNEAVKKDIPSSILHKLLGSLGYSKEFTVYKGGRRTKEKIHVSGCQYMQTLYKMIIIELDRVMMNIAKTLGQQFYSYHTDCIYFDETLTSYVEWAICKEGYKPVTLEIRNVKVEAGNIVRFTELKKNNCRKKTLQ
jgi:hypothetical protein